MSKAVLPKVLFVDDEQPVLDAIAANLRRTVDVMTATSGAQGLEMLKADPRIQVVVSDMRMPAMNGAAFLTQAREVAPLAVRMLLTGQADLESAITAVNKGQIFRFLTKPCPRDELRLAIETAVEQYRLITAERELLEQTLRGSIKMFADILAMTNPAAFGRASRITKRVLGLAEVLGLTDTWQLEVAALSSQLGYITLPPEVCDKLEAGAVLSDEDRRLIARAPETTAQLLANIPRLEGVREILEHHVNPPPRTFGASSRARALELGAHLLRFALDVDELEMTVPGVMWDVLRSRSATFDAEVWKAYEKLNAQLSDRPTTEVSLSALRIGMVLAEDVRLATGALLVARGYEITNHFIERIRNFPRGAVRGPLRIVT